jgi:hypothetical protein
VYNYQAYGADINPPDTGIIVQHVDESTLADPSNSVRGYPSQSCWPWNGKHYKVAILAADGQYKLETVSSSSYGKGGDANSAYIKSSVFKLDDSTVPSTNQYHYGYGVKKSGVTITVQSDSASCMNVRLLQAQLCLLCRRPNVCSPPHLCYRARASSLPRQIHSLTHSLTHSPTHHSLTLTLTHSLCHSVSHSPRAPPSLSSCRVAVVITPGARSSGPVVGWCRHQRWDVRQRRRHWRLPRVRCHGASSSSDTERERVLVGYSRSVRGVVRWCCWCCWCCCWCWCSVPTTRTLVRPFVW